MVNTSCLKSEMLSSSFVLFGPAEAFTVAVGTPARHERPLKTIKIKFMVSFYIFTISPLNKWLNSYLPEHVRVQMSIIYKIETDYLHVDPNGDILFNESILICMDVRPEGIS